MDGQDDNPGMESVEFFERAVSGHDKVESLTRISDQIYRIERAEGRSPVTVYLTNLYTVGAADVMEIASRSGDVNCIVTLSGWNEYTGDAKRYAVEKRVGLFTFSEFMGALNWAQFWKYEKRK